MCSGRQPTPYPAKIKPPYFVETRRRRHDAAREALLVAKHGERREAVADLVAGERHEIFRQQVFHRQLRLAEQAMVPPAENRIALAQEAAHFQFIHRGAAQAQARCRRLLQQRRDDVRRAHHFNLQIDARIGTMKLGEEFVVDRRIDPAHAQEADRTGNVLGAVVELGFQPGNVAVDVARDPVDLFARLGGHEMRATPLDQLALEGVFEPLERLAHGGLRDVQTGRRAAYTALLHDHKVGAQQVPVEPVIQKAGDFGAHGSLVPG